MVCRFSVYSGSYGSFEFLLRWLKTLFCLMFIMRFTETVLLHPLCIYIYIYTYIVCIYI